MESKQSSWWVNVPREQWRETVNQEVTRMAASKEAASVSGVVVGEIAKKKRAA